MRILVTGNMGYVGPGVIQQLRAAYPEARLLGLDLGYFANVMSAARILPECRVDTQYFGDVRRPPREIFQDVDAVIHLAAISNDPMGSRFEQATLDINHRATVALAAQAREAGVSTFVFTSSCSVYGMGGEDARTEDSSVGPLTAYAKSKVLAEEGLAALASSTFKVTALRFATACGMSERLRLDLVLNDFVASAVAAKTIRILSDGTPWRPLIHVRDMARALQWAVSREQSLGDYLCLNVGADDWNYQVKDLAAAVAKVIPGVDIWVNPEAAPDRRSYRVNFDRFRRLAPDHQPRYQLVDTVAELAEGLAAMQFSDADFRTSSFIRLNVLSALQSRGLLDGELRWTPGAFHP
jgi:nucleoside-diphosphate-sugar epimerase